MYIQYTQSDAGNYLFQILRELWWAEGRGGRLWEIIVKDPAAAADVWPRPRDQRHRHRHLPIEARVHQLVVARNWHGPMESTVEDAEMNTVTYGHCWCQYRRGWQALAAEGVTAASSLFSVSAVAAQNKKLQQCQSVCPGQAGEGGGRREDTYTAGDRPPSPSTQAHTRHTTHSGIWANGERCRNTQKCMYILEFMNNAWIYINLLSHLASEAETAWTGPGSEAGISWPREAGYGAGTGYWEWQWQCVAMMAILALQSGQSSANRGRSAECGLWLGSLLASSQSGSGKLPAHIWTPPQPEPGLGVSAKS